jgi:hypothetical protein
MSKYNTSFSRARFFTINSMFALLLLAGLSTWTQLSHSSNGTGQKPDKMIERGNDFDAPVKLTLVKSYSGEIETDKKIFAGDDWLKGLTVRVLNTSGKPVTHVTVELHFRRPKEQAHELDVVHALRYGLDPFFPSDDAPINSTEPILPGQSVDVVLPDDEHDAVRSILSQHKYPGIKEVKLVVRVVGFSDGTAWTSGAYFKRDTHDPNKWIRVRHPDATTNNRNPSFF